jgi:hypothetical protein
MTKLPLISKWSNNFFIQAKDLVVSTMFLHFLGFKEGYRAKSSE